MGELRALRMRTAQQLPADLKAWSDLRFISLARLEGAIVEQLDDDAALDETIVHLAGLQRIRYVLVDPAGHDIILAGPAEGWVYEQHGEPVGATTGQPVLYLDDLLVALRTAEVAAQGGINCSIDPTADGLARLEQFLARTRRMGPNTVAGIEQALGPQQITVGGVPATSHLARVLVAADFKMKRLAMGLEPSPVNGLPSFLSMLSGRSSGMQSAMPRWWLATDYDALLRDEDGLTWELRGSGVRAMSEEDFRSSGGQIERGVRVNPLAQRWADLFSERYEALAQVEPVFGQLRTVMDLAVVAALVVQEDLAGKAGYRPQLLLDPTELPVVRWPAPQQVASQASVTKRRNRWIVTASGGVQINSWQVAAEQEHSDQLANLRPQALTPTTGWWWDAK